MNIFFVDRSPKLAAEALYDKHVTKMISESTQLLSAWAAWWTQYVMPMKERQFPGHFPALGEELEASLRPFRQASGELPVGLGGPELPDDVPWTKLSHQNHPAALWLREGLGNVQWLVEHTHWLVVEYDKRYPGNKDKYVRARDMVPKMREWLRKFVMLNRTAPRQCMPDQYKVDEGTTEGAVQAYRRYYVAEKLPGATYREPSSPPSWRPYEPPPPPKPKISAKGLKIGRPTERQGPGGIPAPLAGTAEQEARGASSPTTADNRGAAAPPAAEPSPAGAARGLSKIATLKIKRKD